jgi:CheY-like chemotaxis protein
MARILIVDEDALLRSNLRRLLVLERHEVTEAVGGLQGIELALADPPDLVLCDLVMPDLGGLEVMSRLRSDPRTALVPLVLVTGGAAASTVEPDFANAADGYVRKPFEIDHLLAVVSSLLERRGRD